MSFTFITRRPLWQNILIGFSISVFMLMVFLFALNKITNHGEYIVVPEVLGRNYLEVQQELEKKGFEVVIQDSIYIDSIAPSLVLKQFPEPDATVKINRVVYLTINAMVAPTIPMPDLQGKTLRRVLLELKSLGLKLGDTIFVPDLAKNAIKEQMFQGKIISPGSPIRVGSKIDLVIGSGLGEALIPVPDFVGLTYTEALDLAHSNGISFGGVAYDDGLVDTALGYIYWQNPTPFNEQFQTNLIRSGQLIDIKIGTVKPVTTPAVSDTIDY